MPVGGGGFSLVAVGGLGEASVGGRVRREVEVEIAEEKREALVTVLVESEEDDFAAEVAGVFELEDVFVGCDGAGRVEGSGQVRRGVVAGGELGGVDVAGAGLVPRFAGVEIGLDVPVVGEVVLDAEAALEGGDLSERRERSADGGDGEGLRGGRERRGEGGGVDEGFGLARAVEAIGFGGDGFGNDGGEESGMEVEDGFGALVDGPGEAGARGEVGVAGGRGLEA